MGCKSHHAMLDPYCGGTTCTRAAGSVLLRAKLIRGQSEFVLGRSVVGGSLWGREPSPRSVSLWRFYNCLV